MKQTRTHVHITVLNPQKYIPQDSEVGVCCASDCGPQSFLSAVVKFLQPGLVPSGSYSVKQADTKTMGLKYSQLGLN